MRTFNDDHRDWLDIYPVEERLAIGAEPSPEAVMMVDVGGRHGKQAINLKRKFPHLPGKFVVQDLLQGFPAEKSGDVEYMVYDFRAEQPIKCKETLIPADLHLLT